MKTWKKMWNREKREWKTVRKRNKENRNRWFYSFSIFFPLYNALMLIHTHTHRFTPLIFCVYSTKKKTFWQRVIHTHRIEKVKCKRRKGGKSTENKNPPKNNNNHRKPPRKWVEKCQWYGVGSRNGIGFYSLMYDENVERPLNMRYAGLCVWVSWIGFWLFLPFSLCVFLPIPLSFSLFYNFVALLWHCLLLGGE